VPTPVGAKSGVNHPISCGLEFTQLRTPASLEIGGFWRGGGGYERTFACLLRYRH